LRPRSLPTDSPVLAEIWAGVRREADARGVPERGVQLVIRLRARLDAVALRARQQPERPRVACLAGLGAPRPPAAWAGELVGWAGGEPIPVANGGTRSPGVPLALADADPDVIVFASGETDLAAARAAVGALLSRPGWRRLRAVRAGRVYVAGGELEGEQPGPQVVETLEVLAEILHPTAFRFGRQGSGWSRLGGDEAPDGA